MHTSYIARNKRDTLIIPWHQSIPEHAKRTEEFQFKQIGRVFPEDRKTTVSLGPNIEYQCKTTPITLVSRSLSSFRRTQAAHDATLNKFLSEPTKQLPRNCTRSAIPCQQRRFMPDHYTEAIRHGHLAFLLNLTTVKTRAL